MRDLDKKPENTRRNKIKKLIRVGYISCFAFLVSFFIYAISAQRGCTGEINTICRVVRTDYLAGFVLFVMFIIFLLVVLSLIFMRLKYRKEKELLKEIGIGKSIIASLLIFILGFFFILIIFADTGHSSRCKAVKAMKIAEIVQLRSAQDIFLMIIIDMLLIPKS